MFAIAVIDSPTVVGFVHFAQRVPRTPVYVRMRFRGPPGEVHAIHIHKWGDTRRGCESLGPHYDPKGNTHGSVFVPKRPRHAGDLINNLTFDQDGWFEYAYMDPMLNVESIVGRSVVIHAGEDDLGLGGDAESLKTGNAGQRIACAVIGRSEK